MKVPEIELQRLITQTADLHGWLWYHNPDSRRSNPGFPDLVLVKPPRVIFVEVKGTGGRLSPEQIVWLDALAGCHIIASGTVGPDEVDALISKLGAQ